MTKNLSPPKIFETYLDTKTNDTSDFIVNLFENIEKEIEHNRGISLVLLEQVLENIPSIVAQIDETIKANQYTQYIGELLIQNHPRIHILKTKTTQGLHSLWNLNIYLAAQESPTMRGALGFYNPITHIIQFGIPFMKLFKGYEKLTFEEKTQRLYMLLKNERFYHVFAHESQHARDTSSPLAIFQHQRDTFFLANSVYTILDQKIKKTAQSSFSLIHQFQTDPKTFIQADLHNAISQITENQATLDLFVNQFTLSTDTELSKNKLSTDEKNAIAQKYLKPTQVQQETIESVIQAISDYTQNKSKTINASAIQSVKYVSIGLLAGQNYLDLPYHLTTNLLHYFDTHFTDHILTDLLYLAKFETPGIKITQPLTAYLFQLPLINSVINEVEMSAYRLNDVDVVISHALLHTNLNSASFFVGTPFFAIMQSKTQILLNASITDLVFKNKILSDYTRTELLPLSDMITSRIIHETIYQIFECILKENLHEQVKNTIFDTSLFVNPNQTQKYSLKTTEKLTTHFLKTHFRSLFSNFRSFAFESAISTSLDILFAKGIHIQALLHQTKQLFCESLFEAATDIPIFKNYMNMCQNIYTKAYQSKDIILEKLNFGNKHISISRCILFNWLAVGHIFFTSRKFLELKNNLNKVYRAEKDAKYQILVDTQELASLLKEELHNISQHIENRVNTLDRLVRFHVYDYLQISNYSITAKSFVQDILELNEKTTQNLTDAYDECFVHALEIDPKTLETFENKTTKIFGNMFDALIFSIFTHPEIEQYSTKTDEIKVMLSFKRVLDDMSVFNRKEFVNMHTDFVLGAGFLANQKDIPFVKTKRDHTYNDLDKTQYIYTFLQYLEDILFTLEYANALSKSSKLEYLICLTTYFDIIHKVFQNISKAP